MMIHKRWVRAGLVLCVLVLLLSAFYFLTTSHLLSPATSPMQQLSHKLHAANHTLGPSYVTSVLNDNLHDCHDDGLRPERSQRMRNGVWHSQEFGGFGELLVFSAFYDDRTVFGGKSYVRLLAITTFKPSEHTLFCQVWYDNLKRPLVSAVSWEETGRGLNVRQTHYQEHLLSCEVPRPPGSVSQPRAVSVQLDPCARSTILVPVVAPSKQLVHEVGVCVVVAYGDLDPGRLIEWVEFNRLLGVGQINVYDSHVSARARAVFNYYSQVKANTTSDNDIEVENKAELTSGDDGLVVVRPSAPAFDNWCKWCQKLSVIAALNDCMYRNMYRYRHLAVIDFDEIIMPREGESLPEMLRTVASTWRTPPPAFLFRNAYFFMDRAPKYKKPEELATQCYVHRAEASPHNYSPKSIIDPRRCLVMQNHYCMLRTPDVGGQFAIYVKERYALSQHYKRCHYDAAKCGELVRSMREDENARKYGMSLKPAVARVRSQLAKLFATRNA